MSVREISENMGGSTPPNILYDDDDLNDENSEYTDFSEQLKMRDREIWREGGGSDTFRFLDLEYFTCSGQSNSDSDSEDDEYAAYTDLYMAVQGNDWDTTENFLRDNPNAIDKKITPTGKTALHVAVAVGHVNIVKKLVTLMSEDQLLIQEENGLTALDEAILVGNQEMVECILRKHKNLLSIGDDKRNIPVVLAIANGHIDLARYLYSKTPKDDLMKEKGKHGATLLTEAIYSRNLDIALDIIRRFPELTTAQDREKRTPLHALASMPHVFPSGNSLVFWKRWIYSNMNVPETEEQTSDRSGIHIQSALTSNETRLNVPETEGRASDRSSFIRSDLNVPETEEQTSDRSGIHIQSALTTNERRLNVPETEGRTSDRSSFIRSDMNVPETEEQTSDRSGIHIQSTLTVNETRLNVPEIEGRRSDRSSFIRSVLALLRQLVSHLQKCSGMKQLYEMKLLDIQSCELLSLMCEVVSKTNQQERKRKRVYGALFEAIKHGTFEFVSNIMTRSPEFQWSCDSKGRTIFHNVVLYREAEIFSLVYKLDAKNVALSRRDNQGNNILHMAGMSTKSTKLKRIPGAALQMQRELQWFKEVDAIVPPKIRETTNKNGLTPRELFTKNHKKMMREGEEWMKNTATSCTVVGILIVTIMFAAAFTVPGGNNQNTGYPIFSEKKLFMLFIVTNSLSLYSSSTSVMMFLGILTSRYAEEDFLKSLPTKMIIGLSTLFFAITTMMIAFSVALLIMQSGNSWIVIPIICLAIVPVTLFIIAQFRLLVDMSISTYGAGIFDRKVKPWL